MLVPFPFSFPIPLETMYLAEAPEEPAIPKSAALGSRVH